jgi:hypothetical protein
MVKFNRYPHVNDLLSHYIPIFDRKDLAEIIESGISSNEQAETFSRFIWQMVEAINEDEENEITVLGSSDNTEMLRDISYEITKLMKSNGFYEVWKSVSREEME